MNVVIQRLHDMGFSDQDIRAAITECGYHVEQCADWIVNRKQNTSKPRLFVGMEVWIFSPDDNDWVPGNVVSITKQLLSIIFNGHDFRWLEKDSDLYKTQDDKVKLYSFTLLSHSNNTRNRCLFIKHTEQTKNDTFLMIMTGFFLLFY